MLDAVRVEERHFGAIDPNNFSSYSLFNLTISFIASKPWRLCGLTQTLMPLTT